MKFYQITDLHYYPAREMNASGKEWETRAAYDQKCIAESEAIIDATIDFLLKDADTDIATMSATASVWDICHCRKNCVVLLTAESVFLC